MEQKYSIFKHPTSIIDSGAEIGEGTKIWHWTHISSGALIGKDCVFGQNVYVGSLVKIGNNVKVQNNVSIYDETIIEDDVFCGPSVVFTNVINPRSKIIRKNEYKRTIIKRGATLGANSTIVCGNSVGESSFIAAGAVVTSNVIPFALMAGTPARHIGWMSSYGERIDLPLNGKGIWECEHTGEKYILDGATLRKN